MKPRTNFGMTSLEFTPGILYQDYTKILQDPSITHPQGNNILLYKLKDYFELHPLGKIFINLWKKYDIQELDKSQNKNVSLTSLQQAPGVRCRKYDKKFRRS